MKIESLKFSAKSGDLAELRKIKYLQRAEIHIGKQQQKIFDCLKGSQKLLQRFKHNTIIV